MGIIDRVRHLIRQTSDDTVFQDELLYALLLDARTLLMYREYNKNKVQSKLLYTTLCMPLIKSKNIPCECLSDRLGCTVLKSKFELPKPIKTHTYEMLTITTLDGRKEFTYKEIRAGKYNIYSRLGKTKPYFTIYNKFLYLIDWPENNLEGLLINIIPEDPTDLDTITFCDNGITTTCFDPLINTFNIDSHLIDPMINMVLEKLGITLKIPEAVTNNAIPAPKANTY